MSKICPMHLTQRPGGWSLLVTQEEVEHLVVAHKAGDTLCYEDGERRITITPDGTLTVEGFVAVPRLFGALGSDGYLDLYETFTKKLKRLVRRAVFAEGTESLGDTLFGFSALKEVVLPDSLLYLCDPFEGCEQLKPYPIPPRLTMFRGHLFGKVAPERVVLPDTVDDIEAAFQETTVRSVTVSRGVTGIPRRCFYRAECLEEVIIPEGVQYIGGESFCGCKSLSRVVFPSTLTYINDYAFAHCTSLEKVELPPETEIAEQAFHDTPIQKKLRRLLLARIPTVEQAPPEEILALMEELRALLGVLPISEQVKHFSVSTHACGEDASYGITDREYAFEREAPLWETDGITELLTFDGVLVGIRIKECTVFLGQTVCTYSATEEDGTGSRSVSDYASLYFHRVPHE